MNRIIIAMTLGILAFPAAAELAAPARTVAPIMDPTMVVMDRGAKLEVYPTRRVVTTTDSNGRMVANVVATAGVNTSIGAKNLGVVFNHAMQQQGYISGEIAFQMKPGVKLSGFSSALYPGLKKITAPEVYVVNARTPSEFIAVLKRLQARSDLEWVEPTVTYGSLNTNSAIR